MARYEEILARLQQAFPEAEIRLQDESAQHKGHASAPPEGESHYALRLVAPQFAGQARLARQRAVYQAVGEDLMAQLHALRMEVLTPEEALRHR